MSGAFLIGRGPDGKDRPAVVNADGALKVDIGSATLSVTADGVEIKNDSGNPIPFAPIGLIDGGNGYSGTLSANQVFTGTGIEASPQYGTISVCVFSSHASASQGLKFQASIDNVNWETIEEYTYSSPDKLESYSFAPSGRYFRLIYANGATQTTKTAIFTVLRTGYTRPSSHRIGDTISAEKDAELVKAVLAAQKPNGTFTDINSTAGGNLKVSLEEAETSVVVGIKDAGNSVTVDSKAYRSALDITRPANQTAYPAGSVIGTGSGDDAVHTLANIGPSGGFIIIQSIELVLGTGAVPSGMSGFRLHFYRTKPTAAAANASLFDLAAADRGPYIGYIDMPTPVDLGATCFTQVDYPGKLFQLNIGSTSLFCELQTIGGFTPAANSEVYSLRVKTLEAGL